MTYNDKKHIKKINFFEQWSASWRAVQSVCENGT